MKTKILAFVSVAALMVSGSVYADTKTVTEAQPSSKSEFKEDAKQAWKNLKEDSKDAYEEVKAYFIGDEKGSKVSEVTYDTRKTVNGMLGKPLYNAKEEKVGTIRDIILDKAGNAVMVVIADGEFTGFEGKLVAVDYNLLSVRNEDGDIMAPLTEEGIDNAAEFSYDLDDKAEGIRLIPDQGISVAKLLEGQLVDANKETLAEIDNITLKNGKASDLIVGFDKVLGMGGEKLAVAYNNANLIREGDEYDFQLTANQAAQFEAYKKSASN